MIKVAVCDDEPVICEGLRTMTASCLTKWNLPFEITCYTGPQPLLQSASDFSVILLDVQMPDLNGISLAKSIRAQGNDCPLIFITAHTEQMPDAFLVEAVDYLIKPVDETRFADALKRALKKNAGRQEQNLLIKSGNHSTRIKCSDLCYCEVINRKIYLHTTHGVIECYGKLEETKRQLDHRFFRCHRSYLVNLDYLFEYKDGQIRLESGDLIPVSRLRHRELLDCMVRYMKGGDLPWRF